MAQRTKGSSHHGKDEAMQIDSPDDKVSLSEALDKIYDAQEVGWSKRMIPLPFTNGLVDDEGRLGDLDKLVDFSFLDAFYNENDRFLPQQLFVRQEMRDIFSKLIVPHQKRVQRRILTGSPGIGKSVLFFLAAIQRAFALDEKVLYFRKAEERRGYISVFVMEKAKSRGGTQAVNVVFSQDIKEKKYKDMSNLHDVIVNASQLDDENFYTMLDGPKHNDPKEDLLYYLYQALCTSGGYPAPSQAEARAVQVLVMSGWTEVKLKQAMKALGMEQIDEKYQLTGGRIRMALWDEEEIEEWFLKIVDSVSPKAIKLAVTSRSATGCTESSDRLRTRFFSKEDGSPPESKMIVDSRFAFSLLKGKLKHEDILEACNLAHALGLQAARGWFYEDILHRRFRELADMPDASIKVLENEEKATAVQGVTLFVEHCKQNTDVYWAPPTPNFANIDAAILLGSSVLLCFQYTVQNAHSFNRYSFWTEFANKFVVNQVPIQEVHIVFVTPSDVLFDVTPHVAYEKDVATGQAVRTRSQAPLERIRVTFSHVSLDPTCSAEDVAKKLLTQSVQQSTRSH